MNTSRDERLAQALCRLTDAAMAGELPEIDAAANGELDLVDELRTLWATAALMDQFGPAMLESPPAANAAAGNRTDDLAPEGFAVSQIVGDYELIEPIGRGGMGIVYRARQRTLNRIVALKMVLRGELATTLDRARFRAEAESAAKLDHPNIVPVYEVGEHHGQPFFSMKYVDGITLADLLRDGPLTSRDAAGLLLPVCRAIAHAHRGGVLHRDLKPSNILIRETTACESQPEKVHSAGARHRTPFVTDFGLAKRIESDPSLTGSGAVVGTPSYMAPEQAAGHRGRISPASDVYSLGAILYQMVTGRPPFQAPSPVDTVLMVLEQDPVPPRLLNRELDSELEWIALKCLQKPADLRYSSADELADDLQAYLVNEPIAARRTSLRLFFSRMLRETHHASVLENWGLLWIWHAVVLLTLCVATNVMQWFGIANPGAYLGLWGVGLGAWATMFWAMRRRAGPITFVERQIAHVWAGSVINCSLLFVVEMLLGLPVLTLSPILALVSGTVFLVKAGILSGLFYFQAAALFVTGGIMALFPAIGLTIFGLVSAACFFIPGLKYYRQNQRAAAPTIRPFADVSEERG